MNALNKLYGLAFLVASGAAAAQSEVKLYGILDAGIQVDNNGGAPGSSWVKRLAAGNQWASRIGVLGTEDLGAGLKAVFNIESGINNDTGEVNTVGTTGFWARRSVVGLKGSFGEVYLGRDYSPGFWTVIRLDRNLYGLPGTVSLASQLRDARIDNGVFYTTPTSMGFTGRFALAAGEGVVGRFAAAAMDYKDDRLYVSATVHRREMLSTASTPAGHNTEWGFGADYKLGQFAINGAYWKTRPLAVTNGAISGTSAAWAGLSFTSGPHVIYGQLARTHFDYVASQSGASWTYGLSYNYILSKRTNLYASYGGVDNDSHARLALITGVVRVGGTVYGADPKAGLVGIKHTF